MGFTNTLLFNYFKFRQNTIEKVFSNPEKYQHIILKQIVNANKNTAFGRQYGFNDIRNYEDYQRLVPTSDYHQIYPYIEKMMSGEQNQLVSDRISWFAKSSGTTTGKSKYIPVSYSYLKRNHLKCAWDAASFIYNEDAQANLFADKSLIMGGTVEQLDSGLMAGDISGIIIKHFPPIGRRFYTPDFDTALMKDWDAKIERMAQITSTQNLTLLAGVPSWVQVLLKEVLRITGKQNISEVWPNIRSFLHGGVNFEPYRSQFAQLLPSPDIKYREVYNASEGYFAIQNNHKEDGMLLLCDHEIFYEFVEWPLSDSDECVSIENVELDKTYVMVISNTSGLYRYNLGDLVRVVSLNPVKIKIVGRAKAMLNVFGEELSIENTEMAISKACKEMHCSIKEYTVAPIFMQSKSSGRHEWFIEFDHPPKDMNAFARCLDTVLCQLNSDYEAKRSYDLVLRELKITELGTGTFERWMRSKNKFGGQNKVARLQSDRVMAEEILRFTYNTE